MAEIVRMPKLSDTMTDGVVAEWHKKIGDEVASGELLADIETDKATMEFESFYDGILLYVGVEKGGAAPINSVLAIIGEKGEKVDEILAKESQGAVAEEKVETPPTATEVPTPQKEVKQAIPTPAVVANNQVAVSNGAERIVASPLAKAMAKERGINLTGIIGSGEGGRIVKRDVENYTPSAGQSANAGTESFVDVPVSQMRKTIARRLADSKFSAPHFYLTLDIDMDNAIASRKSINASGDVKVSFNDMVVKATAMALRKHPNVNSSWLGDVIRKNAHIHIGVAVAVDEGLLVPVIRFADTKGLSQIGAEVKDYAQKAKDKKLQPADWEGNTFTISNLGMFGIESFTAIVNPPDSCILAIGGIKQVPVVRNGALVPGNVMKVTLSCDHRVVDGATGAAFLQTFKDLLENPVKMIV